MKKLSLVMIFLVCGLVLMGSGALPRTVPGLPTPAAPQSSGSGVFHGLYFYSVSCPHCQAVLEEVIQPLQSRYGAAFDLRLLETTSSPTYYELLIEAEDYFNVSAEDRAFPTLVAGEQIFIGEEAVRAALNNLVEPAISGDGLGWPAIPDLQPDMLVSNAVNDLTVEACESASDSCEQAAPIYAAYFYQVGCQECSRAEADLTYLESRYPQLVVEEFNVYDQTPLGEWLAERAGRSDFHSPSLFIRDRAWIGAEEITPDAIEPVLQALSTSGAPRVWEEYDAETGSSGLIERFRSMGWLTVVFAGLVDGLNPCAFATLIFFVSYLTLSGRKGREVLLVGGAFTLGVFLAYLVIGLGFYKVLDLLGNWLQVISRWVYALTALLCLGLAVFSFLDYLKARKGKLEDMALNLPHAMRMRINATIRQGRSTQAYALGAFATGLVISFLELACTGQVYLPTIIFVSTLPDLRLQAVGYLLLYNLLFILPLVVVFILAYYGTTSKDLTAFLQRHAGAVKLGMVVLFVSLAAWLGLSLLA